MEFETEPGDHLLRCCETDGQTWGRTDIMVCAADVPETDDGATEDDRYHDDGQRDRRKDTARLMDRQAD